MNSASGSTNPHRVLFVHADAGLYGSGVSLLELASRLPRDRYQPLVALPSDGPLATALRNEKVAVEVFPLGALHRTKSPREIMRILTSHHAGSRRLSQLIKARNISLVHSNCSHVLSGATAARSSRIPHIAHIRENILPPKVLMHCLARILWSQSDRVIAVSHGAAKEFLGKLAAHAKVRVIYNGVDLHSFLPQGSPAESRGKIGWPQESPHLGVLARFTPWKGHRIFLEAAAKIAQRDSRIRFVIIGDSDTPRNDLYKAELIALSQRLGIAERVCWTGFVAPVQPLLSALDLVVVPSVRPEPFGRAVVEAMAMERPVIATAHGGPAEILANGGGLLVPPGDATALAEAALDTLRDESRWRALALAAREQVKRRFDINHHVAQVMALYDELLSTQDK